MVIVYLNLLLLAYNLLSNSYALVNKLLCNHNGTTISTSFVLTPAAVFLVMFTLDLNDPEFVKVAFG